MVCGAPCSRTVSWLSMDLLQHVDTTPLDAASAHMPEPERMDPRPDDDYNPPIPCHPFLPRALTPVREAGGQVVGKVAVSGC